MVNPSTLPGPQSVAERKPVVTVPASPWPTAATGRGPREVLAPARLRQGRARGTGGFRRGAEAVRPESQKNLDRALHIPALSVT